jgi:hypothetical protein
MLKVIAIIAGILLLLALIFITVRQYNWSKKHIPFLLSEPIRGNEYGFLEDVPVIDENKKPDGIVLPHPPLLNNRLRYSTMFWVKIPNISDTPYVDDDTQNACIWSQGDGALQVYYGSNRNKLIIMIKLSNTYQEFQIENFANLQKWNMVCMCLDNRNLDVYVNGNIKRSYLLSNVPYIFDNGYTLFPGQSSFYGAVSCMEYFDRSLNAREVLTLYNKYKIKKGAPRKGFFWWTWVPDNAFKTLLH